MSEENKKQTSIVDALVDVGRAWADHGLALGRTALEGTARALGKTAESLEAIRAELAAPPPPPAPAAKEEATAEEKKAA
jgi:hypothetical protein